MEYLVQTAVIPYLRQRFHLTGVIKTRVIHTAGVGESQIDDLIGDLEAMSNPTVGLAAHSGQVDVRITAKAGSESEASGLIQTVEDIVRKRLGNWVYGADADTLEEAALKRLRQKGWSLTVVESGLHGKLIQRLAGAQGLFLGGEMLTSQPNLEELTAFADDYRNSHHAQVVLGVAIHLAGERQEVYLVLVTPMGKQQFTRPYGGPPENAPRWALHHSLDLIRKLD
jgi:hypothetical protein